MAGDEDFNEVVFTDCFVPDDQVVGRARQRLGAGHERTVVRAQRSRAIPVGVSRAGRIRASRGCRRRRDHQAAVIGRLAAQSDDAAADVDFGRRHAAGRLEPGRRGGARQGARQRLREGIAGDRASRGAARRGRPSVSRDARADAAAHAGVHDSRRHARNSARRDRARIWGCADGHDPTRYSTPRSGCSRSLRQGVARSRGAGPLSRRSSWERDRGERTAATRDGGRRAARSRTRCACCALRAATRCRCRSPKC